MYESWWIVTKQYMLTNYQEFISRERAIDGILFGEFMFLMTNSTHTHKKAIRSTKGSHIVCVGWMHQWVHGANNDGQGAKRTTWNEQPGKAKREKKRQREKEREKCRKRASKAEIDTKIQMWQGNLVTWPRIQPRVYQIIENSDLWPFTHTHAGD